MIEIIGFPQEGDGIGKKIGFPTVNFTFDLKELEKQFFQHRAIDDDLFGVYAGEIAIFPRKSDSKITNLTKITLEKISQPKLYKAAINFGSRPTLNDPKINCEAFILDFDEDFAKILADFASANNVSHHNTENAPNFKNYYIFKIKLLKKIREIKKFKNLIELKSQISKDVEEIKKYFLEPILNVIS